METELLRDYGFGRQQLTEILGHACANAIAKVSRNESLGVFQMLFENSAFLLLTAKILMIFFQV